MPADDREGPSLGDVARNRSVILFLIATFVLELGISAQITALGKRVFDISGRELDLGLLGLAEFLPVALLVFVTGPTADRFDRRKVAALALVGEAAFSLFLIFEVRQAHATMGPIFGLVIGYSIARAFLPPAIRTLPSTMVAPDALPRMNALYIGTFQAGIIVGPVVGGFLYTVGSWVPFALNGASLLAAAALILAVHIHPSYQRQASGDASAAKLSEALKGLRVIRGEPVLLGAISLDLFAVLFGGAVALLPAVAEERLHVGAVGLGWLRASVGIGAASMTAYLAIRPVRRNVGRMLFLVVGIFGVGTIVFGMARSSGPGPSDVAFALAFASLLILSAADSVSVFIRSTLVPLVTPNEVRGRVSAVEGVFIGASNELGAFESGLLGQAIGAGPAIVAGGAATLLIVVLWPAVFPAIRRLDRFPEAKGAMPAPPLLTNPEEVL